MLVASVRQRLQWAGEPLKSQAESVRFTQDRDTAGRIVGFTIQSDGVFPQGGQLYFEYSSTGVTNTQAETVFRNQAGFNGATHTGENRLTPSHTSSEKYDLKSNITGDSGHDMSDLDTAVQNGGRVRHATVGNSVVVSGGDDGGILDRKTQRQTISDDRYKGMLSKSHPVSPDGHYAGNVITYSVVINPAGRKMLTDPNATLRLRDELTYTHNEYYSKLRISYVPGSAKLYEGVRNSRK